MRPADSDSHGAMGSPRFPLPRCLPPGACLRAAPTACPTSPSRHASPSTQSILSGPIHSPSAAPSFTSPPPTPVAPPASHESHAASRSIPAPAKAPRRPAATSTPPSSAATAQAPDTTATHALGMRRHRTSQTEAHASAATQAHAHMTRALATMAHLLAGHSTPPRANRCRKAGERRRATRILPNSFSQCGTLVHASS